MVKMATIFVMAIAVCLSLAGCGGIKMDDIKGDWTIDTVDDKPIAEFAQSLGLTVGQATSNITIKEDNTMTFESGRTGVINFDIKINSDKIDVFEKGKTDIYMQMVFDKSAGTLTFYADNGQGGKQKNVLKKGKATLEAPAAAAPADANADANANADASANDGAGQATDVQEGEEAEGDAEEEVEEDTQEQPAEGEEEEGTEGEGEGAEEGEEGAEEEAE